MPKRDEARLSNRRTQTRAPCAVCFVGFAFFFSRYSERTFRTARATWGDLLRETSKDVRWDRGSLQSAATRERIAEHSAEHIAKGTTRAAEVPAAL